ncbi:MAG: ATP-grasp domain-containing protein [Coxiellaceae bacterium]|nr:ATP-grasp domain-containing protein [Coxiellaceae bacterium]
MINRKTIVVVDAYSTGRLLASRFKQMGFSCVHVQTQAVIPNILRSSFQPNNFIENIVVQDGLQEVIARLKRYDIQAIVAGSETGVAEADQLCEYFDLPGNGVAYSQSRYNKFEMIKALQQVGVPSVPCIQSKDLYEILQWSRQQKGTVVLKPLQSAGNDGVYFCQSTDDIKRAFTAIIHQQNIFNHPNDVVLAQALLMGTEYIINSVSRDGQHHITDIWRCEKHFVSGKSNLSLLEALVHPDDAVCQVLIAYAEDVLNALHIVYGPGHMEVMLTEQGPILIEAAARLQGCVDAGAVELATGASQLSQTVLSYADPQAFKATRKKYRLKQYCYRLFMRSTVSGYLHKDLDLSAVEQLPSFYSMHHCLKKHAQISETLDIATTPGYLHFVNANSQQIQQDYLIYREYEEKQLFSEDMLKKFTSDSG